jgi:RHH-type transcriptional regulator, proline utilization regulon repressor / proline dehydrogenase / delta 1-pyrroline-5-carboxylate dehydrogenase
MGKLIDTMEKSSVTSREIEIGKELFDYIAKKQSLLDLKSLFLRVSTFDPKLQTQIFKFVDVLPNLKEKESVVKILSEYLDKSNFKLGSVVNSFSKLPIISNIFKSTVTASVAFLARIFICGQNTQEAVETINKLKKKNQKYTLDLLGEVVLTQAEADHYYERYQELIHDIDNANVSVKLSALVPQINQNNFKEKKEILKERLRHLYHLGKTNNATVNVDSEHHSWHELIFDTVKEVLAEKEFENFNSAGIVIQAYLKESEKDLDDWVQWLKIHKKKITVRLVKGAYWDYEQAHALQKSWDVPVFEDKALTDVNYEKLTEKILNHTDCLRPAFASHNIRSLAYALKLVEEKNISKDDFEIQMLFGMLDDLKDYFSERGYCLRVYLPYGELLPGMSYLVRRLLENTANDSFLKQGFIDGRSQDELLKDPQLKINNKENLSSEFVNSADINFETEKIRNEFQESLQKTKLSLSEEKMCPLIINGEKKYSSESFTTINPANKSQVLAKIFKAGIEDCNLAIVGAKEVQKKWFELDVEKRAKVLKETAKEFEKKREFLNSILILESGKAWQEADAETSEAIDFMNYYALQAEKLFGVSKLRSLPGERNTNAYQALGIGLVISPWNFPLAIMLGMTVATLVTGNAVLVKPSSQTCLIAYEALSILLENIKKVVGKEYKGLISFLPGSGSVIGEYLINHEAVSAIAFTGSNQTGMRINEAASKSRPVKNYVAEMGGKNVIIIEKTADLDEAIPGVIYSAFGFSGQKCSACSRVIVEDEIYDDFKERMLDAMKFVKVDDPQSFEIYTGPVIDENAYNNIHSYIDLASKEGSIVYYDESKNKQGYFINPLIVENLIEESRITKEEIFGPVLAIYRAKDIDHALELANNTEFGLTAGLYSRSPKVIEQASKEIQAGNFYINRPCTGAVVSRQAFGGHKNSSIGFKAGGPNYLLQFVKEKTITENTMRRGFADD